MQEVSALVEEQFVRLQKAVEEARQGAAEVLEGERRQALSQAESIQTHLEQKKSELLKILSQMSKLTRSKSDVDFLQVGNTIFSVNPDGFQGCGSRLMRSGIRAGCSFRRSVFMAAC